MREYQVLTPITGYIHIYNNTDSNTNTDSNNDNYNDVDTDCIEWPDTRKSPRATKKLQAKQENVSRSA